MGESLFTNVSITDLPIASFDEYRRKGKFLDLIIETEDKEELKAHRVVLWSQFPAIESTLPDETKAKVKWNRFHSSIVNTMLDYAYTGKIRISLANASHLYLLAHNLGCSKVISWCSDVLKESLSSQNLEQVWSIANVTSNKDLIITCIPLIATKFEKIRDSYRFLAYTEPLNLERVINDPRCGEITEDDKVRILALWANTALSVTDKEERNHEIKQLLAKIDIEQLSREYLIELVTGESNVEVPKEFRTILLGLWKKINPLSEGCLTSPRNVPSFSERLLIYALDEGSEYGVLMTVPEMQTVRATRYCIPYRPDTAIVILKGDIYIIGGKDNDKKSVAKVQKINSHNGRVSKVAPLGQSRFGASAVAYENSIKITPMLKPRFCPAAIFFEDSVYVTKGANDSVEALSLGSSQWTLISECPTMNSSPYSMAILDGNLLLASDSGIIYEMKAFRATSESNELEYEWFQVCELPHICNVTLLVTK
ncbi:unnamed protein product [Rodentolepis nana]|uniref:BTB domain-containing protein n=1 Tax=Rodentolepis nana TaxID=102285 RepID=A0A0R3TUC2_RODNA|nr:unnamed protein product [Rodentolepis nana]